VRYADDQIVGFQHWSDAERFLNDLKERLAAFALCLHPEKTRLIEFGSKKWRQHPGAGAGRAV
jgi:RNA-directed DNA polymerase